MSPLALLGLFTAAFLALIAFFAVRVLIEAGAQAWESAETARENTKLGRKHLKAAEETAAGSSAVSIVEGLPPATEPERRR